MNDTLDAVKNLFYIHTGMMERGPVSNAQARREQMGREIWQKYTGETADNYDNKRVGTAKHEVEQSIICRMLDDLTPGSFVLDCPVGTGRFLEFYKEKGFICQLRDASPDMIAKTGEKLKAIDFDPVKFTLCRDDARELGTLGSDCVDASLMIRLTRWLSPEDCQKAFKQFQRVTRDRIIITARVENHSYARPIELFTDALEEDWELAENAEGYEPAYRILLFKRK